MEVDQEVEEAKAESDPIELFHLLALYFAHTAPAKNVPRKPKFELLPPDYLLNVGYASELNIFSSKDFDLMRLSKKVNFFNLLELISLLGLLFFGCISSLKG